MTKARKRKRVHRVARGKPKPGHIVAHNRRRRKGEILCHNHVLHTAATANGVHGFHWFTVSQQNQLVKWSTLLTYQETGGARRRLFR
jgi:hypothetical protein